MSLIEIAFNTLTEAGFDTMRVEGFPVINMTVAAPNGKLDAYVHAHEDSRRLLVYVRPKEVLVSDTLIPAVGEFITRANYGLPLGNFEFDWNDGELNFKNSIDLSTDGQLTPAMVKAQVGFALECVNRYLPGLQAVLRGENPRAALEAIDGPSEIRVK